ncbi:hypothetical protein EV426DRAFT_242379 [Tirmania nivea]|nr:hypothetical protein EV426DRAFT_242379 [Tirmania nivea]
MAWCYDCNRYFVNEDALQQHLDYAAVHRPVYYCEPCRQYFSNAHGLEQHEKNSIQHLRMVWVYACELCSFGCDELEVIENHKEKEHYWCKLHDRFFQNENNLRQHKLSKAHGRSKKCPLCSCTFPTFYALTLHLEAGTCASGMNRRKVDQRVHEIDRGGVFTDQKRIGFGEWESEPDIWADFNAWNGSAYECDYCDREYGTLGKLNGHITQCHAPKRTEYIYSCPGCGRKFKLFSQLMGHVEQTGTCTVKEDIRLKAMLPGTLNRRTLTMG